MTGKFLLVSHKLGGLALCYAVEGGSEEGAGWWNEGWRKGLVVGVRVEMKGGWVVGVRVEIGLR